MLQGTGWVQRTLLPSCPAASRPRAKRWTVAKLLSENIKKSCIYNVDLSVSSRKRYIQKWLVNVMVPPHVHTFPQTSISERTHPGEAGGEATLIFHYGCKLKNLQISSWNIPCKAYIFTSAITNSIRGKSRVHTLQVNNPFQNATVCVDVEDEQLSIHWRWLLEDLF